LQFHPASEVSAEASQCANDQGKYWEFHDKVFSEQSKQGEDTITYGAVELKRWASEIGIQSAAFNNCLDSGKYKSEVSKDYNDGLTAGVNGTPTFFINGQMLVGAQPYAALKAVIDAALK